MPDVNVLLVCHSTYKMTWRNRRMEKFILNRMLQIDWAFKVDSLVGGIGVGASTLPVHGAASAVQVHRAYALPAGLLFANQHQWA